MAHVPDVPDRRRGLRAVDWADDRGQIAGFEAIPLGLLTFVVGALLVANLWSVIDTKMAANSAAREGVHAVEEAAAGTDPSASGREAARRALVTYGRDPGGATDWWTPPQYPAGVWQRCARIAVTVTLQAPLVRLPLVGAQLASVAVSSTQVGITDPYRSSAPAGGTCA